MKKRAKRGLATWLTSTDTPLFLLDDRMVVLVFNRGCEQLTGWQAADVIGRKCEYISEGQPDRIESLTGALCPPAQVQQGQSSTTPVLINRVDGTTFEKIVSFFPLQDPESGIQRVLGVITDRPAQAADSASLPETRHFELARLKSQLYSRFGIDSIVATGPHMQRVVAQVRLASLFRSNVLLTGEYGVGKEHIARTIHYASEEKEKQFIALDCHHGTRFEITRVLNRLSTREMGGNVGAVLLREVDFLKRDIQERAIEAMQLTPELRWMATSLQTESQLIANDFSDLLLCRLSSVVIQIPPLRTRSEDLLLLAQTIIEAENRGRTTQRSGLTADAATELCAYSWPGNVNEFVTVLHHAMRKSTTSEIEVDQLPVEFRIGRDHQQTRPVKQELSLDDFLATVERAKILDILQSVGGNRSLAAERLGIPRAKLYRRLAALNIESAGDDFDPN